MAKNGGDWKAMAEPQKPRRGQEEIMIENITEVLWELIS